MAELEGQPKITSNFKFEWRVDEEMIVDDEDNDEIEDIGELLQSVVLPMPQIMDLDDDEEQDNNCWKWMQEM